MNLDCHTPKGKTYIQKQHETGLLIESFFSVKVKHTTYDAEKLHHCNLASPAKWEHYGLLLCTSGKRSLRSGSSFWQI